MAEAAGVTFYVLLSLFPALAAFISIYGKFNNASSLGGQLGGLGGGPGEDGHMNARFTHPAGRRADAPALLHDDTIKASGPVVLGPACCCPANPVVQVIMPATTARPHPTELLLCGHHYRVSRPALRRTDNP